MTDARTIRVPVLTYHGVNVNGDCYSNNDHIALHDDLRAIRHSGRRIIPLSRVVDWLDGDIPDVEVLNGVAISFDDGSWFDYYDLPHPLWGKQRSFFNLLRDFQTETGASAHATSFVIASPDARQVLDKTCMIGKGWWTDDWWQAAQDSGMLSIENHSWDHLHPTLDKYRNDPAYSEGAFAVHSCAAADAQVKKSQEYITRLMPKHQPGLFAYPWGDSTDYLVQD